MPGVTAAWILVGVGALLTLGTAVFVAAEFALVALDPAHVDESTRGGKRVARALRKLSTQLSGAQVGITFTTILLGYTAQPAVTDLLRIPLDNTALSRAAVGTVAGALSLVIVNVFSMVFGELVPKNLALSEPQRIARLATPWNWGFTVALKPVIAGTNALANAILRVFGIEPREELSGGRSTQELAALVRRSAEVGTLDPSTALLLKNTIELDELAAIDVMTDRTRMVVLSPEATANELLAAVLATGHSRFPVIGESHDDVLGLVHMHHAIAVKPFDRDTTLVRDLMVDAPDVPETMKMRPLLGLLRGLGLQMAIVVDEYGGTAGLVTFEDVVEELVGEVADEHDRRRVDAHRNADGAWTVPGRLRPDEIEELTGIVVPEDAAYETVGGFVMARLGRVAVVGDEVDDGPLHVRVESVEGRRVEHVRIWADEPEGDA